MDLKAAHEFTETAYAYGTSKGAVAGWDVRGRGRNKQFNVNGFPGKDFGNFIGKALKSATKYQNDKKASPRIRQNMADTVKGIQKIRQEADSKGYYTHAHIRYAVERAPKHQLGALKPDSHKGSEVVSNYLSRATHYTFGGVDD